MRTRGALTIMLALALGASVGCGGEDRAAEREPAPADDDVVRSSIKIPTPKPLGPERIARWAPVKAATVARETPGGAAIAPVGTQTPEGTQNLLELDGRTRVLAGRLWVGVRLAVLPNGRRGWVPRRSLGGYTAVDTRLVVDRRRLTAALYRGDRVVFRTPVAVGEPDTPTPAGRFYVRAKLSRYSSPAYGPVAFGTSGRSPTLTDWPAGGFVGIHGTDRPDLIPGRVSHGCIRMPNAAILRLARLMAVGTPVVVT